MPVDILPNVLVAGPGDGTVAPGFVDGNYKDARFRSPVGMFMGNDGFTLYICDYGNNAIRTLDTKTLDVGTYVSGAPLDHPMHLTIARSGNMYVTSAKVASQFSSVVKITPGRTMSVVGQSHNARGIAVDANETVLYMTEQGHYFFTELWRGAHADMTTGGVLTDKDSFGDFTNPEGMILAPDGYLYCVTPDTYYYSTGGGLKRFVAGGTNVWNESGASPGQTSFGPFSSPNGGDYGRRRRSLVARNGSDGRLWVYNVGSQDGHYGIYLTKLELGETGGIFSDDKIGIADEAWGIALNNQDTIYFSASRLQPYNGNIEGQNRRWYFNEGVGLNSIYKIGCPPNPTVVDSDHSTRIVIDDGVQTIRMKMTGAPEFPITADRSRCGKPIPAVLSEPETRLRARNPGLPG